MNTAFFGSRFSFGCKGYLLFFGLFCFGCTVSEKATAPKRAENDPERQNDSQTGGKKRLFGSPNVPKSCGSGAPKALTEGKTKKREQKNGPTQAQNELIQAQF